MPRLIEVQHIHDCKSPLLLGVGDLVVLPAFGGRIKSGDAVVEILGIFMTAIVGSAGSVVTPIGAPNRVLVLARQPGTAMIDLYTGDPWHSSKTTSLEIQVENDVASTS